MIGPSLIKDLIDHALISIRTSITKGKGETGVGPHNGEEWTDTTDRTLLSVNKPSRLSLLSILSVRYVWPPLLDSTRHKICYTIICTRLRVKSLAATRPFCCSQVRYSYS